ncbi:BolA/IbaG family iron-sulfur metabolism protein [Yoonia litorea]|uniref:Acid stress-induced BolA-like protein IbaG/YrbA, predicted regulator of iron metabolism n=1 Tax=Yoonia litorea TaxID=1123755 RepID=A0A1I6MB39_9RHOB|nr:BolA/IbaG family iron-sulfur metabolism protein [Yoonia litorea]SFS12871.1 Acid stress-induced BolA-like protein IbaG/YrbA, predicted regulator of iron metabolism [Yoonia litorea]
MAISARDIEALIREKMPNATIQIEGDDGVHFQGLVIDESFRGMNRIQQQRSVMAIIKPKVDSGEIHALGLTTRAPE